MVTLMALKLDIKIGQLYVGDKIHREMDISARRLFGL
jgi:hypothetical protein